MALIKCPECGRDISTLASSCPQCGYVLPKETTTEIKQPAEITIKGSELKTTPQPKINYKSLTWFLVSIGIMISMFFVCLNLPDSPSSSTSTASTKLVQSNPYDGSVSQVKKYLENNLRDPESIKYAEWSKLIPTGSDTTHPSGYVVRCKYRAKNGFGGYVLSNDVFILDSTGNVVSESPWTGKD
jgi:hypothetical protein